VVMMYVRYPLSLRNVEDLLFERGIDICHETVRPVVEPVRPDVRRRDPPQASPAHASLHALEVASGRGLREDQRRDALTVAGRRPRRRGAGILCHQGAGQGRGAQVHQESHEAPRPAPGDRHDGLRSYRAALKEIGAADRQETGRWLNNRAENSTSRFQRRERAMLRFRRMKTLQKFSRSTPKSTTISARSAISSAPRIPGDAPPHWRSGRQSCLKLGRVWAHCARVETSCRWTDSTLPHLRSDQARRIRPVETQGRLLFLPVKALEVSQK